MHYQDCCGQCGFCPLALETTSETQEENESTMAAIFRVIAALMLAIGLFAGATYLAN